MKTALGCYLPLFATYLMFVLSLFSRAISQEVGDVRLVYGDNSEGVSQGRVEVYSDLGRTPTWARLCDAGWNRDVASVVCRQLGFDGVRSFHPTVPLFGSGGSRLSINLIGCMPKDDVTSLEQAGCQQTRCRNPRRVINADVSCLVSALDIAGTSTAQTRMTKTPSTAQATSTVSATTTTSSTSVTKKFDIVSSDLMTTESYMTTEQLPRKGSNVAAILGGVFPCLFIAIIVIIILLCLWSKKKNTKTSSQCRRAQGGVVDRENDFQLNEYQYRAAGPAIARISDNTTADDEEYSPVGPIHNETDVAPRVLKQDSDNEYQNLAAGPIQNGADITQQVPKQDSFDEYQYSAVGPMQNCAAVEPSVPKQDSGDVFQYLAVGPIQNGTGAELSVPKQISVDEDQYSAVGPIQDGGDAEPRVPEQDPVDEDQYSAVGPIQDGGEAEPKVSKQDSVDEYQYSAVGQIPKAPNGADVETRVPRQESSDDDFYAPVDAIPSNSLNTKAAAFANVCTDESLYIIPERSEVNPYQELTVKTSTFAGLQKLRKKPVLEENTQQAPKGNVVKQSPEKPKKPIRKSHTHVDNTPAQKSDIHIPAQKSEIHTPSQKSAIPHQPTEVDNAVYGLEVIGSENGFAASLAAKDRSEDHQEAIYANEFVLQETSSPTPPASDEKDSPIHQKIEIIDEENPYENSIIGDQSFMQEGGDSDYQALSRKATLPV